ncbi:uncharacterized protein LOC129769378 isoform X1 [Toxorhynchites rutilus septentrionalis]|uniref:uncharacterized protein LOC129769378 isoform X1 n=1 Tax=Toxorhynchites rutilus septentrionalis TaxID=329112 RepID=UPI002479A8F5|nr:uncharacterized protein LOC129769378 isoform X1 [Toxorhynchites rutilus septentrionalis]
MTEEIVCSSFGPIVQPFGVGNSCISTVFPRLQAVLAVNFVPASWIASIGLSVTMDHTHKTSRGLPSDIGADKRCSTKGWQRLVFSLFDDRLQLVSEKWGNSCNTLNYDLYCQQMDRLKLAIDQKRSGLANRRGVVFHQDNARPHNSESLIGVF